MACKHRRFPAPAVPAIILIALGVLFLLSENHLIPQFRIWQLWPAVLILAGGAKVFSRRASAVEGWVLICLGAFLLAWTFGYVHLNVGQLWPLALIVAGVALLYKTITGRRYGEDRQDKLDAENLVMFGGVDLNLTGQDFSGTELTVVFGGYNLDLRKSIMSGNVAIVNVSAVFGGVELRIPEEWNVTIQGSPIFGAFNDETTHPDPRLDPPRLLITGSAVFGGVNVRN